MAHCPSVVSARSIAFSRNSISETRPELGQLALTTSSMSFCWPDIAPSTTVDLPTVEGSREMTSVRVISTGPRDLSRGKRSFFPFCTALLSAGIFES